MKKRILSTIIICMLILGTMFTFASVHTSTLSIQANSSVEGSYRAYTAGAMKIDVKFSQLIEPTSSNPMTVTLHKKKLLSYDVLGSVKSVYPKDTTVRSSFGTQVSGDYRFKFTNYGSVNGGTANYVAMGNL